MLNTIWKTIIKCSIYKRDTTEEQPYISLSEKNTAIAGENVSSLTYYPK